MRIAEPSVTDRYPITDRTHAEALDSADPLAAVREQFELGDPDTIYLDGNSLGRLPLAVRRRLHELIDEWGADLVAGWEGWLDLPRQVGDRLGTAALGAAPGQVLVCDCTTVNLYKLAAAALEALSPPGATSIVTDSVNFPTDRYVLDGLATAGGRRLHLLDADPVHGPSVEDIARLCHGGDVALVVLSHVGYRSGAAADLPGITAACAEAGVPIVWDLSHSVGALPVELDRHNVPLAVGCTYKYLNAGPGAPAFVFVRDRLLARTSVLPAGWFAHREPFAMATSFTPSDDIRRMLVGTPPVIASTGLAASLDIFDDVDMHQVRAKSLALGDLFVETLAATGAAVQVVTPAAPAERGAQLSLRHPDAYPIVRNLADRGVIGDFRAPDIMRFGFAPLYTRYVDAYDAAVVLADVVATGSYRDPAYAVRSPVT